MEWNEVKWQITIDSMKTSTFSFSETRNITNSGQDNSDVACLHLMQKLLRLESWIPTDPALVSPSAISDWPEFTARSGL